MLETDWNTSGTREFPFGVVLVDSAKTAGALNESSVVYAGGPTGDQIVCFMTGPT